MHKSRKQRYKALNRAAQVTAETPRTLDAERLFDLVRLQRHELHLSNAITDDEYTELMVYGAGSVKRLESYDGALAKIKTELAEAKASLKLMHDCDMRAISQWQAAHPGQQNVWPDRTNMIVWLMGVREQHAEADATSRATKLAKFIRYWWGNPGLDLARVIKDALLGMSNEPPAHPAPEQSSVCDGAITVVRAKDLRSRVGYFLCAIRRYHTKSKPVDIGTVQDLICDFVEQDRSAK